MFNLLTKKKVTDPEAQVRHSRQTKSDVLKTNQIELQRASFMSPTLQHHRKHVGIGFFKTNVLLACFTICVLSIYWGATYNRPHYLHTLDLLAVVQDDYIPSHLYSNNSNLKLTSDFLPMLDEAYSARWHIYNTSSFIKRFNLNNASEINDHVTHLIYEEDYWMSVNINANSTLNLLNSLLPRSNSDYKPFNFSENFMITYESGRDPTNLKASMLPLMQSLEKVYENWYTNKFYPSLLSNISSHISSINVTDISNAGMLRFGYYDHRQFFNYALVSPLQVGLIYCLLLTAFQFAVYGPMHAKMSRVLTFKHLIIYRIVICWSTMFFLSLYFCTVSAIYRIKFDVAFGKAGFVVYWMSTWMVMLALGGANENAITIVNVYGRQYLMIWLMSWIIVNISPSFYPLALNDQFYRYGYCMPVHQAVDIFKVIFLNLTRKKMGRNYGILIAWIAVNTALLPVTLIIAHRKIENDRINALKSQSKTRRTKTHKSDNYDDPNRKSNSIKDELTPDLLTRINALQSHQMDQTETESINSNSSKRSSVNEKVVEYTEHSSSVKDNNNEGKEEELEKYFTSPSLNTKENDKSSKHTISNRRSFTDPSSESELEDELASLVSDFSDPGDGQNRNNNGEDLHEDYQGLGYEYDAQHETGFGLPYDVSQDDQELARLDTLRATKVALEKIRTNKEKK